MAVEARLVQSAVRHVQGAAAQPGGGIQLPKCSYFISQNLLWVM